MPAKKKAKKKTSTKKKAAVKKKSAPKKKKKTVKKAAASKKAVKKKVVKKVSKSKKKTSSKKAAVSKKKAITKKAVSKKAVGKKKTVRAKKPARTSPRTGASLAEPKPRKAYQKKAGEEYMNTGQANHFRKILNDWKRDLLEEVDRTVHHMQDEASNFPDPNDRATQEEEFALELRTRDRERKLIKKINEALLSLDTGEYG